MSRIFEALRNARQTVAADRHSSGHAGDSALEAPDRRRSRRWMLNVSVYVYGYGPGNDPFHEEAHTLNVNDTGALLILSAPVTEGQTLLIMNRATHQEQACRVIFTGTRRSRTVEAGVAFLKPDPEFWRVASLALERQSPSAE